MVEIAPPPGVQRWTAPSYESRRRAPPPRPAAPLARRRSAADLAGLVEGEIIPRLMMAHRRPEAPAAEAVGETALSDFQHLALSVDADRLLAHVQALVRAGLPAEQVLVAVIIPTARRLGDDWDADLISFAAVTTAMSRLQLVVARLAGEPRPPGGEAAAPAACFLTEPGRPHAFGLFLAEDRLRRDGWRTSLDSAATAEDAAHRVGAAWFDLVALSAGPDTPLDAVTAVVSAVRRRSLNPALLVMVGGRSFVEEPARALAVGADVAADTAARALSAASEAVSRRALA